MKTNYLVVNEQAEVILQMGLVKVKGKKEYHCSTFMVDYKENINFDVHYRNLMHYYEIQKVVRENKKSKCREVIYQSERSRNREQKGIEKLLELSGIKVKEKLVKEIYDYNVKYGKFHNIAELVDKGIIPKSIL